LQKIIIHNQRQSVVIMRIAILTSRFPKTDKFAGGAEISAFNVANIMAKRGHDVYVITRKDENLARGGFKLGEVRFIGRPSHLRYLSTAFHMVRALLRVRPDVIYCQTLLSESFAGIVAGRLLRVPVAVRAVGEIYVRTGLLERLILKFIMRSATIILPLTEHMRREVLKFNRDAKVAVVPEGADYDFFRNYPGKARNPHSVLFVGRLTALKSVDTLLRAFMIAEKKMPGATLTLIGDGEQGDSLRKLSKGLGLKGARFLGSRKREEVAAYMKSSGMLVLPSVSEGFPLVIPEAMASGLPIVATRIRGMSEIVEEGANGYLVEPRNPEKLAERMILLMKSDEIRNRIGKNNIKKAEQFNWGAITDKLLQALESLKK